MTLRISLLACAYSYGTFGSGQSLAVRLLRIWLRQDPMLAGRIEVEALDFLTQDDLAAAQERLVRDPPDILGLSCYVWSTPSLLPLAEAVHRARPETFVLLGGPDAAGRAETLLGRHPCVSAVASGEGEEPLRTLVRRLSGAEDGPWQDSPGFWVREGGALRRNPEAARVPLDELPTLLDDPEALEPQSCTWLESARGCRFHCAYCQFAGAPRQVRSLELLVRDLDRYLDQGGGLVYLVDAGLNQDRERFREILRAFAERPGLRLGSPTINLELLDPRDIAQLSQVLQGVSLGIGMQTTHPPTLRNIKRGYRAKRFAERAGLLRDHGVAFTLDLIYGLPGDSFATFRQSMRDAYALLPRNVSSFQLQVLPASPLHQAAARFGLCFDPEPPYLVRSSASWSPADLERAGRLSGANELVHLFSGSSELFQRIAMRLGQEPVAWIEAFMEGDFAGGVPLSTETLTRWSQTEGVEELFALLRRWMDATARASGLPGLPGDLACALEQQIAKVELRITRGRTVRSGSPRWPQTRTARPRLSPEVRLCRLFEPEPDEANPDDPAEAYTHRLFLRGRDHELGQMLLSEQSGWLLERADGTATIGEIAEQMSRQFNLDDGEALWAELPALLQQLDDLDLLDWVS